MNCLQLPFFNDLEKSQNILLAGAGDGFDIFGGLPLYFGLRAVGKKVHIGRDGGLGRQCRHRSISRNFSAEFRIADVRDMVRLPFLAERVERSTVVGFRATPSHADGYA
jgi:hypothetical protein